MALKTALMLAVSVFVTTSSSNQETLLSARNMIGK